jgi:hypothetical protein
MVKIKPMEKEIKQLSRELKRAIKNLKGAARHYEKIGLGNTALILGGRIEAYQTIKRRLSQILKA